MATKTLYLSTLGLDSGTHHIQVRAKAKGYADSSLSEAVSYTVGAVMYRLMRTTASAVAETATKTFDLSTLGLSIGTHSVQVRARAKGYADSSLSGAVYYVVQSMAEGTLFSADDYMLADTNEVQLIAEGG